MTCWHCESQEHYTADCPSRKTARITNDERMQLAAPKLLAFCQHLAALEVLKPDSRLGRQLAEAIAEATGETP